MRLKKEGDGTRDMVCCPVCTLYLRKEVTLQEHLDTHPKQQVIEALVRVKDACKDVFSQPALATGQIRKNAGGSASSSNSHTSVIAAAPTVISTTDASSNTAISVSGASGTETGVPHLQMAAASTNHFIPYPQFIGSLGGAAVVPQYVSLPLVSADAASSQNPNQAPVMQMLYNPYMYSTAGPTSTSAGPSDQLEHVQYISGGVIRSPFHILQTPPSAAAGVSQTPSPAPAFHPVDGLAQPAPVALTMNRDVHFHPKVQSDATSCAPNKYETVEQDDDTEVEVNVDSVSPTRETDLSSPSARRARPDWYSIGSPGAQSTCSTEGGLRVRTDLSVSSITSPPPSATVLDDEHDEMEHSSIEDTTETSCIDQCNSNYPSKSDQPLEVNVHEVQKNNTRLNYSSEVKTQEDSVEMEPCDREVEVQNIPSQTAPCSPQEASAPRTEPTISNQWATGQHLNSHHLNISKSSMPDSASSASDQTTPEHMKTLATSCATSNRDSSNFSVLTSIHPRIANVVLSSPHPHESDSVFGNKCSIASDTQQSNSGSSGSDDTLPSAPRATAVWNGVRAQPSDTSQQYCTLASDSQTVLHLPSAQPIYVQSTSMQQTAYHIRQGWLGSNLNEEYITPDVSYDSDRQKSNSFHGSQNSHIIEADGRTLFNLGPTPGAVSVVGMEGLRGLVSSQFVSDNSTHLAPATKHDQATEPLSPGRPASPVQDSRPPSPYHKFLDSSIMSLNIQTDETMPPRGELSEQESNGGNSSSMWSVPPYQMTRDLLSPVVSTSYDLTARESWTGSDISDNEGNANPAPDASIPRYTVPQQNEGSASLEPNVPVPVPRYNMPPSFSNTLPALISRQTSGESVDKKPVLPNQVPKKNLPVTKPTPKPRVYKCKACTLEFNCPKERRVHKCEKKKELVGKATGPATVSGNVQGGVINIAGSSGSDAIPSEKPKTKRAYKRKPKAALVKKEVLEERPIGQSRFQDAFLQGNAYINKMEPEEAPGQIVPDVVPEAILKQDLHIKNGAEISTFSQESQDLVDQDLDLKLLHQDHRCTICGLGFTRAKDLSRHRAVKHKDQRYQCTTCGETFEKESLYLDHLLIHPLECRLCGKCFNRRKSLNLHMKWHMDVKPYKCPSCDKSFVTKQKLDEHQNTHTGNAPIKCPHCDETFKRYSNLIQHKNRHHLNVKRKVKDYICHCGEIFHSKKKLDWHKEIHDDKPKSCQFCSERFVHTASLTRHVRKAHDRRYVPKVGREVENVECPICNCVFLKSSLATHMRIHSGERPFSCHICGKDFTTKWNLQLHRWTHASRSSKPFKCTLCKAAFYRKQDYNSHMRSHRNVRPFTCNHCGCQFIRKYNCLRHMKEHEEGKSYTCNICQKTFHRSYYLKDHMRVHSGVRPFTCHICGKASTTKSNHNKHVRIHHAREPQNTEI